MDPDTVQEMVRVVVVRVVTWRLLTGPGCGQSYAQHLHSRLEEYSELQVPCQL